MYVLHIRECCAPVCDIVDNKHLENEQMIIYVHCCNERGTPMPVLIASLPDPSRPRHPRRPSLVWDASPQGVGGEIADMTMTCDDFQW